MPPFRAAALPFPFPLPEPLPLIAALTLAGFIPSQTAMAME